MPKRARQLGALEVSRLEHPGGNRNARFAVGGVAGLLLQITPTGGRSWLMRYQIADKRRELGLGPFPDVTLAMARERAREARESLRQGVDPIEAAAERRRALVASMGRALTFDEAASRYLQAKLASYRNEKHRRQWKNTLETYASPTIGQMGVVDIEVGDVLRVLQPIWETKTETASRVRQRIEHVLAWATVSGFRTGDNPAAWRNNLDKVLPAPSAVKKAANGGKEGRQPTLAIDEAPRWFAAMAKRDGMAALALLFQALTASRSGAVRLMTWDELDEDAALWTIQPGREASKVTKSAHRVPLTPAMLAIIERAKAEQRSEFVFPAARDGALSDMSLSQAMKRLHEADKRAGRGGFLDPVSGKPAVPHGLRSVFRDWAAERTNYPGDMAEIALGHVVGSAVERAYRRGDMLERRRAMMAAWGDFLAGQDHAKVIHLGARE